MDKMKTLQEVLGEGIYFNPLMAGVYSKDPGVPNPALELLKEDITMVYRGTQVFSGSELEATAGAGIDFTNTARGITRMAPILEGLGIKTGGISFEEYIDIGEKVIRDILGIKYYHRFPAGKISAHVAVSADQLRTFSGTNLRYLVLGNLGEAAMREILLAQNKEFIARGFLFHNSKMPQEEKDIRVFLNQSILEALDALGKPAETTLGVRAHESFKKNYLYSKDRVRANNAGKGKGTADYVAFFNHFCHRIFYLTGIVEREFLVKDNLNTTNSPMEEFVIPESCNLISGASLTSDNLVNFLEGYGYDASFDEKEWALKFDEKSIAEMRARFAKRLNPESYFERLKSP